MYRPKIMNKWNAVLKICIAFLCISSTLYAREIDLSDSKLLVSPSIKSPVNETIIQVLQEEIHKRTDIHLDIADGWSDSPIIALALFSDEIIDGKPTSRKRLNYPYRPNHSAWLCKKRLLHQFSGLSEQMNVVFYTPQVICCEWHHSPTSCSCSIPQMPSKAHRIIPSVGISWAIAIRLIPMMPGRKNSMNNISES